MCFSGSACPGRTLTQGTGSRVGTILRKVHVALSPELGPRDFCAQSGILWPGDPQALVQSGLGLDCRGAGKNHGSRVLSPNWVRKSLLPLAAGQGPPY